MKCFLGIDDTDSARGFCTTFAAFKVIASGRTGAFTTAGFPRLVRLNPNIPFKTRGNAAVCIPIEASDPSAAFKAVCEVVSRFSDVSNGANTGVVMLCGERLLPQMRELYLRAVSSLLSYRRVTNFLCDRGAMVYRLGNGMGVVGAAASIGFDESFDHTYELIAYRRPDAAGTKRWVEPESVVEMDRSTFPETFNNFDYEKERVLIAPHGPDPVFAGIRGSSPEVVARAFNLVRYRERLEGRLTFVSNQHTDAHLNEELVWKVFSSGWCLGVVDAAVVGVGRHVYLTIRSADGLHECAVYEPTGDLRRAARMLTPGDLVRLSGGVRRGTSLHPKVLNVERIEVLRLADDSAERNLARGVYISSPRANRHLSKPLIRYGNERGRRLLSREDMNHFGTLLLEREAS